MHTRRQRSQEEDMQTVSEASSSIQWPCCSDADDRLPPADAAGLPPKAKGSPPTQPTSYRPEYRLLPSHRRLWSWGWTSSGASVAGTDRSIDTPSCSGPPQQEEPADPVAWSGQFPVRRGGTVVFTLSATASFSIAVYTQCDLPDRSDPGSLPQVPWLGVRVGSQSAELVYARGSGYGLRVLASTHFQGAGYGGGEPGSFWLSFDPDNCTLKYGKGCRMLETTFLSYTFTGATLDPFAPADRQNIARLFSPLSKQLQLQHYSRKPVVEHTIYERPLMAQRAEEVASVTFDEMPLLQDPSPRLLENSQMILSDFLQEDFTFPASLPPVAQALSQQVLQPWLTLEGPSGDGGSGASLADAIAYSLATPGAFLHTKLEEKIAARSEGVSARRSHLTVALSQCNGSSPGAPVILEILPAGHSTAPHDNANAYGVLRLLHGTMEVALYDMDLAEADESAPLDEVELERGDAMWFSPLWYQNHAMRNDSNDFCCYLLCRHYAADDDIRWPYIQYKGAKGEVCSKQPEADLNFKELHTNVMAELEQAMRENSGLLESKPDKRKISNSRTEAWVERTDSALEYSALEEAISKLEADKPHRYGCGPFRRRTTLKPKSPEPRFLFRTPAIPEEATDNLSVMWP